ncbi:MAG: chemotaxis protein CheW [Pirellulales bacterium]|nr:chemotaxis protein CheW [Pirellulales bacterium]
MSHQDRQFCTFHVDTLYLGIDVQEVQEVIRYQEMTRIPLATPAIRGLINLRGQIVTAIDLRSCLELPPRKPGQQPMNVVVRDGENAISLLVDSIGDVVEVRDETFEPPPATARAKVRELIRGTYKQSERLLLELDTERTIAESCAALTAV